MGCGEYYVRTYIHDSHMAGTEGNTQNGSFTHNNYYYTVYVRMYGICTYIHMYRIIQSVCVCIIYSMCTYVCIY